MKSYARIAKHIRYKNIKTNNYLDWWNKNDTINLSGINQESIMFVNISSMLAIMIFFATI